ncbi:MAG: hypothetical protein HQ575_02560 [Candidatus Omnitrophica bacterium]|nr:hypothetical protein [Candidatus Omnitrophota bacterium]
MAKKRAIKIRKRWRINPRTRVKESSRLYKRRKTKRVLKRMVENEA